MTSPVPAPTISTIEPSKNKTWLVTAATVIGLIISVLTWVQPVLPEKFSAVALVILSILAPIATFLGKYKPTDSVIVPTVELNQVATPLPASSTVTSQAAKQAEASGDYPPNPFDGV